LGVAAGVLVNKLAPPFVDALVVALAAGTFVYVGATEIIAEEFEGHHGVGEKWLKFASLLVGMGSVLIVTHLTGNWDTHTHSHTHMH
jgi:zinc transporter 1/2/3